MNVLRFSQVTTESIENKSGVYAWYYKVSLGDADIQKLIDSLKHLDEYQKSVAVEDFLNRHFYQFFKEANYQASITGKLMPAFKGELAHIDQSSASLKSQLLTSPELLWEIKSFIKDLDVDFSSPIYIGMADNLNVRLNNHKRLIDKFKKEKVTNDNFDDRDENFAARVASKQMLTKNLYVSIKTVESDSRLHTTLENLMNRINYPVLGRN